MPTVRPFSTSPSSCSLSRSWRRAIPENSAAKSAAPTASPSGLPSISRATPSSSAASSTAPSPPPIPASSWFAIYADDDQILNTAVSFPIAFRKAILYGAEGKLELPHWKRFSGFLSYSCSVGYAWFPVTGGLFLGSDAVRATTQLTGHFPDSQDQRNTIRARLRYQLTSRVWIAAGSGYGSGLPFDFDGTCQQALAEYGPSVVDRINLKRGRIQPTLVVDASLGAQLYKTDKLALNLQADGENLNNRLNMIDFGRPLLRQRQLPAPKLRRPPRRHLLIKTGPERSVIVRRTIMRSRRMPPSSRLTPA